MNRVLPAAVLLTLAGCTTATDGAAVGPEPTTPGPTAPVPAAAPVPESAEVGRVIDGDTVELADGRVVRLVGIDTPERGDCGFDRASRAMERLVLGRPVDVVLPGGETDTVDRYDRLIRYVDVDGRDAGLAMVRKGLAIARYDSRDGYGSHSREGRYVRADARSPDGPCRG